MACSYNGVTRGPALPGHVFFMMPKNWGNSYFSSPRAPKVFTAMKCPGSQSLLFKHVKQRISCAAVPKGERKFTDGLENIPGFRLGS